MDAQLLAAEIGRFAELPGVQACALVDRASGLVLHSAGSHHEPALWEAAVEYWRLHERVQHHFKALGGLGAVVAHHIGGMLVLLPCGQRADYLMAAVGISLQVDWKNFQQEVKRFGQSL